MPFKPAKHCPNGHPSFTGDRCPACSAAWRAKTEAARPSSTARGYNGRWGKARASYLMSHPVCVECPATATVVDHIIAHKGDKALFWNPANWQPMCSTCHSGKTARQDGGFGRGQGDGSSFARGGREPSGGSRAHSRENWASRP